ncbi:MAG: hypothetical protein QF441_03735 [Bacteriovoracaceae bacterium]|jgi:hypothetical protein|nr:hypothetical protein [Halobacteriovoraceae bacterium]MDP7319690.1 hypothetical protein [Bacteriovoracaceae bacterium]|tara:strand:- start:36 stop:503 length:468 start_codon:yes stop_codon:yes gene_type:complete
MKNLVAIFASLFLVACASNFNPKKKVEVEKFLGESVFKQDGKMINKFQVFDHLAKNQADERAVNDIKKDYVLAVSGGGLGAALVGFGLLEKNGSNKMLVGGVLVGLGYYFAIRADQNLSPYVQKHNKKVSNYIFPEVFQDSQGKLVSGLGLKFNF